MSILKEETTSAAQDTLAPMSMPSDTSKLQMINTIIQYFAGMSIEDLSKFIGDGTQNNAAVFAAAIPDDAAAKNQASIAMKEEVNNLFEGEDTLSEDFKSKAAILFEAAVGIKTAAIKVELEEQTEKQLEEAREVIMEEISNSLDRYVTYAVKEWMAENKIAIESGIKTELAEEFFANLKSVMESYNVVLPESEDILANKDAEINQLKEDLKLVIERNIELTEATEISAKEKAFNQIAEGLAQTQIAKLKSLTENVSADNLDEYKKAVLVIKNKFVVESPQRTPSNIDEVAGKTKEEIISEETPAKKSSSVDRYTSTLSKMIMK